MKDIKLIKETLAKQKKSLGGKFGVQINIYGGKGSGKTYKGIQLLKKGVFKKPIVYRLSDDFDFLPKSRVIEPNNIKEDLEAFIEKCIELGKNGLIDCIIFDEADLYFKDMLEKFGHLLFDKCRHFFISIIVITRRPQNLNTIVSEEAHFYYYYPLKGDNFYKKLRSINPKIEELIKLLTYQDWHCVFDSLNLKEPYILQPYK